MASPEEVAQLLPETLPDDFSDWDGQAPAAPVSGKLSGSQALHLAGDALRPLSQAAGRGNGVAPGVGRPRSATSTWPDAELPKQDLSSAFAEQVQRSVSYRREPSRRFGEPLKPAPAADHEVLPANDRPPSAHSRSSAAVVEEIPAPREAGSAALSDAAFVDLFREKAEVGVEQKSGNKKRLIWAGAGACVVLPLVIFAIPLLHRGAKAAPAQAVQMSSSSSYAEPAADAPKPRAGKSSTQLDSPQTAGAQDSAADPSAANDADSTPETPVQSAMMNEQLTAPARIAHQVNPAPAGDAPPPVNLSSLAAVPPNSGILSGTGEPVVKISPTNPIGVSSGVAQGMLIQKTAPIYPEIAKQARVSGTVVLQAVISKTGAVKNLRVLSGPAMLRQAALDAVKTWRYKPYRLNNQPVDLQTTINIEFSLGG